MANIYVKPSPGGRVRMPERNFMPMPEAGAWVPRIDYYERLLIGRDIAICDPPADPSPATATETEAKAAKSAPARASKEK